MFSHDNFTTSGQHCSNKIVDALLLSISLKLYSSRSLFVPVQVQYIATEPNPFKSTNAISLHRQQIRDLPYLIPLSVFIHYSENCISIPNASLGPIIRSKLYSHSLQNQTPSDLPPGRKISISMQNKPIRASNAGAHSAQHMEKIPEMRVSRRSKLKKENMIHEW